MSKKTNILNLQSVKRKNWSLKSFFEDFNYSKVLYQDLYIQDYIKNILERHCHESIVHNISIQRRRDIININILFYFQHATNLGNKKVVFNVSKFLKRKKIKKKYRWQVDKKYHRLYFIARDRRFVYDKYYKYILNRKRILKKEFITPIIMTRRLGGSRKFISKRGGKNNKKSKKSYLPIFSLKRLIIINLSYLTGCKVNLHFKNMANLSNFLLYPKGGNKLDSAKGVMGLLGIRPRVTRLVGVNMLHMVHLVFTSFSLKSPQLLGTIISRYLKKNIKSFNFFFNFLSRTLLPLYSISSLRGLKVQFKGRLGTSLRKRTSIILFGSMPLQTINSNIKYFFTESITIYGVCGIKIWYYY